jgi:L-2-hydroxyglutarate oxidase LhgO
MESVDCIVVGAGVVGLAAARALALAGREVLVLERHAIPGSETSSRNSEVIHAGIYYAPGSLKATLCVAGRRLLYAYCRKRGIAHRACGKYIVATRDDEVAALERYRTVARANGVEELELCSAEQVRHAEPEVQCVAGLWSPVTGIVDSHELMQAYIADIEAARGTVAYHSEVTALGVVDGGFRVVVGGDDAGALQARALVNAAGLGAPGLARGIAGLSPATVPPAHYAKGHYYSLSGRSPFRHLVYPVAEAAGLGIHVTLDQGGGARFGPDVEWVDGVDYAFDDSRRERFVSAIRRYYPGLDAARLQPAYTGIRPKIGPPGSTAADFRIDGPEVHGCPGLVNLFGIESPGLTASLAIGDRVAALLGRFA